MTTIVYVNLKPSIYRNSEHHVHAQLYLSTYIHIITLFNMIINYMLFYLCITYSISISNYGTLHYRRKHIIKNDLGWAAISVVIFATRPFVFDSDAYILISGIIHCVLRVYVFVFIYLIE